MKKEKTIYNLKLNETMFIEEELELEEGQSDHKYKRYEVTRVPGGWIYSFDFPAFRQSPIIFIPLHDEFKKVTKKTN